MNDLVSSTGELAISRRERFERRWRAWFAPWAHSHAKPVIHVC
jgi:hypothetical protein